MTKTLNQIIFFSSTNIRIFFSATLGIRIFFWKKTITPPPLQVKWSFPNMDKNYQTDMIVLDFAKAFDKVNHPRLLHKLEHYGIHGNNKNWIKSFLNNRTQAVALENTISDLEYRKEVYWTGTCSIPYIYQRHHK